MTDNTKRTEPPRAVGDDAELRAAAVQFVGKSHFERFGQDNGGADYVRITSDVPEWDALRTALAAAPAARGETLDAVPDDVRKWASCIVRWTDAGKPSVLRDTKRVADWILDLPTAPPPADALPDERLAKAERERDQWRDRAEWALMVLKNGGLSDERHGSNAGIRMPGSTP